VPVVITTDFQVVVGANASVNAATNAQASANFSARAGVGWRNGQGFYPISNFSPRLSYTLPSVSAGANVEGYAKPTAHILLYGLAGPEIALKAGPQFDANITANPWWTLGIPVDLTASLGIPQFDISSPTLHVYRHTFPLAHANCPFSGCPGGSPSRSVTVTSPGDQAGTVGVPASLQIHAQPSDGGKLTFNATGLPAGLSIDPASGLISGIPTTAGSSIVTVTASDATGPSGQTSFTWTINPGASGEALYWREEGYIGRANIDGSSPNPNLITGIDPQTRGSGLAVDNSYIYWGGDAGVGRANLDGSGVDVMFIPGVVPRDVAVDSSHIYWSNGTSFDPAPSIERANLDGSGATTLIPGPATGALAVDGAHIYWSQPPGDAIGRANIDGSNPDPTFITGIDASGVSGLAVDAAHVYWSNEQTGSIGRANLDGSGVDQSFITGLALITYFTGPGVAVDAHHIYWGGRSIGRANVDGSDVNQSFISTSAFTVAVGGG
jgi:hypothetical protein